MARKKKTIDYDMQALGLAQYAAAKPTFDFASETIKYYNILFELYATTFKWKNLPFEIIRDGGELFLEKLLCSKGSCLFYYDDVLKEGSKTAAKWDVGKIAGSYIGVSAAARVASGGGLYKDRNGNTNIAGVPFI